MGQDEIKESLRFVEDDLTEQRRSFLKGGVIAAGGAAALAAMTATPAFAASGTGWINVVDDYSATGDGTTDDTTAIQNALTAASGNGNVVYFPPGTYRITDTLEAYECRLLGAGTVDTNAPHDDAGSVLLIDMTDSALLINAGTTIEGLVFLYDYSVQSPTASTPTVCDWTIVLDDDTGIDRRKARIHNNFFINCYRIGDLGGGLGEFSHNKCTVMETGLRITEVYDIQHITNNFFSFGVWKDTIGEDIRDWIAENGVGILLDEDTTSATDPEDQRVGPKIDSNFFFAMKTAVHVKITWSQGRFVNNGVDACQHGLLFESYGRAGRLPIVGNTFLNGRWPVADNTTILSSAIFVNHTSGDIHLQVTGNHIGPSNGDLIRVENEDEGDGICELVCSGNEFYRPVGYLTSTTHRYMVRFDSPDGRLVATGNMCFALSSDDAEAGGFRVLSADTCVISANVFEGFRDPAVQISDTTSAVCSSNSVTIPDSNNDAAYKFGTITSVICLGNIATLPSGYTGTAYQFGTHTNQVNDHNI